MASLTTGRLLEMMTAFKQTYLLRAAVELRIFDALADGPADPDTVAALRGTRPRPTRVLLRALAAARLVEVEGEEFRLPEGAAELLVSTAPGYVGGIARVASSDAEWDAMRDLAARVRGGARIVDGEDPDFPYWVDFAANQTFATRPGAQFLAELLGPWPADRSGPDVLDVGSGPGTFGFVLAAEHPGAQVWPVDRPAVLAVSDKHAARLGVADRVHPIGGDAFTADLGGPYDIAVLANVLLQYPPERATELLRRVHAVLRPGGRVAVLGFTTDDGAPADNYHAHLLEVLMLAWTEGGELHSTQAYRNMLRAAGFRDPQAHHRPGLPLRAVLATR
jgi:SAM-dependent methyltransferase